MTGLTAGSWAGSFSHFFLKVKIMVSAKDIIITVARSPVPATESSDEQDNATLFRGFRNLLQSSGNNRNEAVDVLINAMIDAGINTRSRMRSAANSLDCNPAHVVIRLNAGVGDRWTRDSDGIYHNLV